MKTLKLTAKDFKDSDNYYKIYCGKEEIKDYQGNIEIEGSLGWVHFEGYIRATGYIFAEAGTGIEAGGGIEAGLTIICKLSLSIKLRIFAGLVLWKKPQKEEMQIICGKLESGEVCFGELVEKGLPKEKKEVNLSGKEVKVTIDGKEYIATIK